MNGSRRLSLRACNFLNRHYSAEPKKRVKLVEEYKNKLENEVIKPRKHPGKMILRTITYPENVTNAVKSYILDTPLKAIINESTSLVNYLKCRHPPPETRNIDEKQKKIYEEILEKKGIDISTKTPEEALEIEKKYQNLIKKTLKERTYSWTAVTYDQHTTFKYLIGRSGAEYAVIYQIFQEIKNRCQDFSPNTYFDFGSGVGTGLWALTDTWKKTMSEYVTVDVSEDMNLLAKNVFTNAYKVTSFHQERIFQRRYLSSASPQYDIVLCAYTLFELPSAIDRLRTIVNLWNKTKHFLVLIEHGTNAGFNLINEARDFILETSAEKDKGYVFAPCPHDSPCPRFSQDRTPCNFIVTYLDSKLHSIRGPRNETYSYVVLHKGNRPDKPSWPRIVRPTLLRSGHTICRMCCENGQLQEVIFTKSKHGTTLYRCSKASGWGDTLPITIEQISDPTNEEPKPENIDEEQKQSNDEQK